MKKSIAIFIFCSALSSIIAILWAFKYIMFGYTTAYAMVVFSSAIFLSETILSLYATTGKSLGIVWAMRKYGVKSSVLSAFSVIFSILTTATYDNLLVGTIFIFLSNTLFSSSVMFASLQTKEIIDSFQK